jgi:hypothetical protein
VISKKYKWVVIAFESAFYLKEKPQKILGGYMTKTGKRWIGRPIEFMSLTALLIVKWIPSTLTVILCPKSMSLLRRWLINTV